MLLTELADIRERLVTAETIAVLGAHREPHRPAFYVPDYLWRMGYRILPVNPTLAGQTLFGEIVVARLADLHVAFDLLDIFRKPADLPAHLSEILALALRPRTVWLQLGITHRSFVAALAGAGFDVVEDRCTYADHRLFRLAAKPARSTT